MKYCNKCKREVEPTKEFSWAWFLLGLICFGVGAIAYLLYYLALKPRDRCPIYGCKL